MKLFRDSNEFERVRRVVVDFTRRGDFKEINEKLVVQYGFTKQDAKDFVARYGEKA